MKDQIKEVKSNPVKTYKGNRKLERTAFFTKAGVDRFKVIENSVPKFSDSKANRKLFN